MEYTTIRHEIEDGILTVVLDRSDHLNAFTVEMADELEHTFVSVNDNDEVRAVIVTGEGRAFCAGMDLSSEGNVFGLDESKTPSLADMHDLGDPGLHRIRDTGGRVTLAIHACRKPVIAAINGAAVGIGATMTLAMDARLLSNRARFGLVFGKLGSCRKRARRGFCPGSSACPRHSIWCTGPTSSTPTPHTQSGWRRPFTNPMRCSVRHERWRTRGHATGRRCRWHSCAR